MEVWISPALSCLWGEGTGGRPRLGPYTQRPHPGSSCPVSSSNVSSPSCPRETTVREQGEVQQHQLSSGGGRGPSLSQRSPESWGCHSSPELTPVTLMRPFSASHIPAVILLCSMVGVGHTPTGLCFWNWFLLWARMSPCQLERAGLALLAPEDHFQSCQLPRGRPDSTWDRWQVGGACVLAMLDFFRRLRKALLQTHSALTFLFWVLTAGSFLQRGPSGGGAGLLRQRLLLADWICSFLWSFMVMGEW